MNTDLQGPTLANMADTEIRSVTDAKAHLSAIVDEVNRTHNRVTLTVKSRPAAVLISPDELAGLEETIYWLSQPGILGDIEQAGRDLEAGNTLDEDEVRRRFGVPRR